MSLNVTQWDEATQLVRQAQRILVVTHVSPDGDAIGSMLGIGHALKQMGKTVTQAVDGGTPAYLRFIPGSDFVHSQLTQGQWDLMIATDCGDDTRYGEVGKYGASHSDKTVNIDHHGTNNLFGDVQLVTSSAVSATEIVFRWLQHMGHVIDKDVAYPLLTGLVTDTLGFRTSNVTADTLAIAQELIAAGVSLASVTENALDHRTYDTIELWKRALPSTQLDGAIIYATITQQDYQAVGLEDVTDGGLVSFLARVSEAVISVVFKEKADGSVEISMRSRPGFDVSGVALELGGGGHPQAAGATVEGPLEVAKERVLSLVKKAARKGKRIVV